jgi:hypothetical protein
VLPVIRQGADALPFLERTFKADSKLFIFIRNMLIYWFHKQYLSPCFVKEISGFQA